LKKTIFASPNLRGIHLINSFIKTKEND